MRWLLGREHGQAASRIALAGARTRRYQTRQSDGPGPGGRSIVVMRQPSKLLRRVRFPSPAPARRAGPGRRRLAGSRRPTVCRSARGCGRPTQPVLSPSARAKQRTILGSGVGFRGAGRPGPCPGPARGLALRAPDRAAPLPCDSNGRCCWPVGKARVFPAWPVPPIQGNRLNPEAIKPRPAKGLAPGHPSSTNGCPEASGLWQVWAEPSLASFLEATNGHRGERMPAGHRTAVRPRPA